jgi:magnesium-transporting ATPase (P-type)
MMNDNIYVRKLDSIMKLPLIDEIISDITGTITKNIMTVK